MNKEKIKTNFYEAVNDEWLKTAKIPGDQPAVSAFLELHLDIEKTLMDLTSEWEKDPSELNDNLKKYIKLYQMTNNFEKRNSLGTKPFERILSKIDSLKTLNDLEHAFKALTLESIELPFGFNVMQDFMNSNNQILYFGAANLFLPDTSYYKDEDKKAQLLGLFTQTTEQLLNLYGFSKEETDKFIKDALAFDALLVPVTKSSVEKADYVKMYNPFSKEDVQKYSSNFDLMGQAEALVKEPVDQLIITNPDFIHAFDTI
ncbi:MAG: M13 family peptidase, partial [Bacillota bacterium]